MVDIVFVFMYAGGPAFFFRSTLAKANHLHGMQQGLKRSLISWHMRSQKMNTIRDTGYLFVPTSPRVSPRSWKKSSVVFSSLLYIMSNYRVLVGSFNHQVKPAVANIGPKITQDDFLDHLGRQSRMWIHIFKVYIIFRRGTGDWGQDHIGIHWLHAFGCYF